MADANIIVKIIDQTRGGLGSVERQVNSVGNATGTATRGFNSMSKAIGAVAAAISVREIARFGSQIQEIQNRVALINPALGTAAQSFQNIADIANRTFQPLDAVADLYQKVARSADQYGMSATQVSTVTESFTNLLRLAGADAAAADGAIRQLGQALGSGALRGDEFNSIVEATAGEILPLLAQELGVSIGQVRELASDGQITGDVLINALGGGATETAERVGSMNATIGQALTVLQNKFLELGTNATPVFDAIASGILLLANNLDNAVVFVTSFGAAWAAIRLATVVSTIGSLTAAMKALNLAIKANPIGFLASAVATAVTLIVANWDKISAGFESAMLKIELAWNKIKLFLLETLANIVNNIVNGFENMGTRIGGVFAGIKAAALDPLNAIEAFQNEVAKADEQIRNNIDSVVDFGGQTERLRGRINDLENQIRDNTGALGNDENATNDLEDAQGELGNSTEDTANTTEDWTDVVNEAEQAARDHEDALMDQYRAYGESRAAAERAQRSVEDSIRALENDTSELELNQSERERLASIIEMEEQVRRDLGLASTEVSEEVRAALIEMILGEEEYTAELLALTEDQLSAYLDAIAGKEEQAAAIEAEAARIAEAEREQARVAREAEREANRARREAQRERDQFTRETERLIQSHYRETTDVITQLEDSRREYIREAERLGLANSQDVMDALLEYDRQIKDAQIEEEERLLRERERTLGEFRDEYNYIFKDIENVLTDWLGVSRRDLEKYSQYAQLFLGVNPVKAIDDFITQSLMGLSGWSNNAGQTVGGFATGAAQTMGGLGTFINNGVFGTNGIATQGIGAFVTVAARLFGVGGGGLFGVVTGLFSGLGGTLTNLFSGVFGFISNGLGGVSNILGNVFSGISGLIGGAVSGTSNFLSNIASGILSIFGLDAGGYIPAGQSRIVGEYGPELVSGPANVTSRVDTAEMLSSGGSSVSVNFTINAVDSKGVDQILVERRSLIADIVRDAVAREGLGV